jgi:predicted ester cyclase
MSLESTAVARRWFEEVWNQRRAETIDELLTPESVCMADDGPLTGPEEFRQRVYLPFTSAFPDLKIKLEGVLADGDEVVVRWSATGTHAGMGIGCNPTSRQATFRGMTWLRIQGGKLMSGWQHSNIIDMCRSLATDPSQPVPAVVS